MITVTNRVGRIGFSSCLFALGLLTSVSAWAGDGKIIATAGLTQVEGSAGGGLVPWATLSGYDTRDQISVGAFNTQVNVDDFRLQSVGGECELL